MSPTSSAATSKTRKKGKRRAGSGVRDRIRRFRYLQQLLNSSPIESAYSSSRPVTYAPLPFVLYASSVAPIATSHKQNAYSRC